MFHIQDRPTNDGTDLMIVRRAFDRPHGLRSLPEHSPQKYGASNQKKKNGLDLRIADNASNILYCLRSHLL